MVMLDLLLQNESGFVSNLLSDLEIFVLYSTKTPLPELGEYTSRDYPSRLTKWVRL